MLYRTSSYISDTLLADFESYLFMIPKYIFLRSQNEINAIGEKINLLLKHRHFQRLESQYVGNFQLRLV